MKKLKIIIALLLVMSITKLTFSYTRDYDVNDPIDHTLNSKWPAEIREVMADVAERLDDIMNGFTSGDTVTDFNLIPINNRAADPTNVADTAILYVKDVDSKAEVFFIDEDGDTMQLTSGGDWIGGISGEIRMWYGAIADIPTGWELADGSCTNACPDLTNSFIVGADADDGGVAKSTITGSALASGGSSTLAGTSGSTTLSAAQSGSPAHTHSQTSYTGGAGGGSVNVFGGTDSTDVYGTPVTGANTATNAASGHTHSLTSVVNIPVFYALAYIIKI